MHFRTISSHSHNFKRDIELTDPDPPAKPIEDVRWKKAGIAAAVLLAPGGFILGGILIARAVRKRQADKQG